MDDGRTRAQVAETCLVRKSMCSSKEKMNAGFRCFNGPLNRENEN